MLYTKIAPTPRQYYIWVDTQFTHKTPIGLVEAEWVGLTSIPNRTWGINVIFRHGGMLYRNVPPNAVRFKQTTKDWSLNEAQLWDCYSYHFTTLVNEHLTGRLVARVGEQLHSGEYLFTATFLLDGYSDSPDQDKEFIFCKLDDGTLTIQPTNRVVFRDRSFILPTTPLPELRLSEVIYSCE